MTFSSPVFKSGVRRTPSYLDNSESKVELLGIKFKDRRPRHFLKKKTTRFDVYKRSVSFNCVIYFIYTDIEKEHLEVICIL